MVPTMLIKYNVAMSMGESTNMPSGRQRIYIIAERAEVEVIHGGVEQKNGTETLDGNVEAKEAAVLR